MLFKYQRKLTKEIENVKTFDNLHDVLLELKKNGVDLGIVTSNAKVNVKKFLKNNNLDMFDFIYSSIDYFHKNKAVPRWSFSSPSCTTSSSYKIG